MKSVRATTALSGDTPQHPMEDLVESMLRQLGEDPRREGLLKTPERVRRSMEFLTQGYSQDPAEVVNDALFAAEDYKDLVICRDIAFFSMCEHHLLPFFGHCHVAYVPDRQIIGLSKMPRLVEVFARRLQVQERLTDQIADSMQDLIKPRGVGVVIQAFHLCVAMRGVEDPHASMSTRSLRGCLADDPELRSEFLRSVDTTGRPTFTK